MDEAAAFEDAVGDGVGQVGVVKDAAPVGQGLVGGEEHGLAVQVPVVDELEEDVGGVGAVGKVSDLVEDKDVGMGVGGQGLGEPALAGGGGEAVDEVGGGGEVGLVAVLDRTVGDGDGQVSLPRAGFPGEDEGASFGDEFGSEVGSEESAADGGLEGEVEFLDGSQEGEAGLARGALDAGLGAVGDFFGDEEGEEVAVAEGIGFSAGLEFGVESSDGGEVETAEETVEVDGAGGWRPGRKRTPSCCCCFHARHSEEEEAERLLGEGPWSRSQAMASTW